MSQSLYTTDLNTLYNPILTSPLTKESPKALVSDSVIAHPQGSPDDSVAVSGKGEEAKEEEGKQARLQQVGFYVLATWLMLSHESRRVFVRAHRVTLLWDDTRNRRHRIQRWV